MFLVVSTPCCIPDPASQPHKMGGPCPGEVANFEHDTLPDASKYIRLVEVLEDNHSEAIQARFRMSTWRLDALPSYHAISYTWGDPESNTAVLINGKTFRIRKNCEFALKQAWWYKSNSYYWIDAICINQANDEEKGKQVAMMGNIYKRAHEVLACVGDHADDSLFLYRHLASTNGAYKRLPSFSNTRNLLRHAHKLLTVRRCLHAAVRFAKRAYFSRLWILQELRNARQANILCGADALPKQRLHRLFSDLIRSVIFRYPGFSKTHGLAKWNLRSVFYRVATYDYRLRTVLENAAFLTNNFSNIRNLLWQTTSLHCTQRRDRVYGIMSLIEWGEITAPIPDYTKSDFEVALDCVAPICEVARGEDYSELMDLQDTCAHIAKALELSVRSDSVSGALKARHGACEGDFSGFSIPLDPPPNQIAVRGKGLASFR